MAFSLLQPAGADTEYRRLPEQVLHDLGLEPSRYVFSPHSRRTA